MNFINLDNIDKYFLPSNGFKLLPESFSLTKMQEDLLLLGSKCGRPYRVGVPTDRLSEKKSVEPLGQK